MRTHACSRHVTSRSPPSSSGLQLAVCSGLGKLSTDVGSQNPVDVPTYHSLAALPPLGPFEQLFAAGLNPIFA